MISDNKKPISYHKRKHSGQQQSGSKKSNNDMSDIIQNLKNYRKNRRYNEAIAPPESNKIQFIAPPNNRSSSNPRPIVSQLSDYNIIDPNKTQNIQNSATQSKKAPLVFSEKDISRIYTSNRSRAHNSKGSSTANNNPPKKQIFIQQLSSSPISSQQLPTNLRKVMSPFNLGGNNIQKSQPTNKRSQSCVRGSNSFNNSSNCKQFIEAVSKNREIENLQKLGKTGPLDKLYQQNKKRGLEPYGRNQSKKLDKSLNLDRSQKFSANSFAKMSATHQHVSSVYCAGEQDSVEDIHFCLVAFYQKAKKILNRVEIPPQMAKKLKKQSQNNDQDSLVGVISLDEFYDEFEF